VADPLPEIPSVDQLATDLQVESWGAGEQLVRVYHRDHGPQSFNPTPGSARFRPVRTPGGDVVPTAYGAADVETALAETLLRGVDALASKSRRRLFVKEVAGIEMAIVVPKDEIALARFRGQGLTRLKLRRSDVIDYEAIRYPYTAEWGQAVFDCPVDVGGIVWTSKQSDAERAVMLWEGPVNPKDLVLDGPPIPLDSGQGLEMVRSACELSGFDFEG
jgi:RES domain